jgi:hypothetical protein
MASKKDLQLFLKERGIQYAGANKEQLTEMCALARETCADVDPDGLNEDIGDIIATKLRVGVDDNLTLPSLLEGSWDLSSIPEFTVIDIYNYLMTFSQYDHTVLRYYYKMEGYTMFKDGFVLEVQGVRFNCRTDYAAVKAKVKPRTNDRDPLTKLDHYSVWITFNTEQVAIKSAYCSCKGG